MMGLPRPTEFFPRTTIHLPDVATIRLITKNSVLYCTKAPFLYIIMHNIYTSSYPYRLMFQKSILRTIITDQMLEPKLVDRIVERSQFHALASYEGKSAFVIKGVRRCGKSTMMKQLMETNFSDSYFYLNFDDERLAGFESTDFQTLLETFIELYGDRRNLFMDEIQNVNGWELFVNRILRQGYRVFITGSNANLLSKELGTRLTGRHIDVELYPFSFVEFLKARNVRYRRIGKHSTSSRAILQREFMAYLHTGGMPEVVLGSNKSILSQLIADIVQKDIVGRYALRKSQELRVLLRFLISNAGNSVTHRSIMLNLGMKSANTVEKYISYAEETYLVFEVRKFERKLKKFDKNPKKVYCIDNGIIIRNSPAFGERDGALLENIVAVQLMRLGHEFFYYKGRDGCEVDFIKPATGEAIQVCYELNEKNEKREVKGLVEAARDLKMDKAIILTLDQEEEIIQDGVKIDVKPCWSWLLESDVADQTI